MVKLIACVYFLLYRIGGSSTAGELSAAVADTIGSGGLLAESLRYKISTNTSYLMIALIAIALTWLTNIYVIIIIASKAFAGYYALQLLISLNVLGKNKLVPRRHLFQSIFVLLFLLMLLVIIFGIPIE